ncbi:UDP-N-acetylenolpyruvoylglucosamine reductase [Candidatus Nomurabacteria bacterium RIFCSPLOWO2_12_FULL_44_11]|uniref:UDP-N-acetylenolpyruvoylglucosamine reductase n=1 Tax=Candidatus Nomurabacteria bacterium RIFCSPLOWO2_12_FULL_44_11 TaxID=1801796 RepID=A0A1F6Y6J8_9BACT|nr:MAG: UDP-N-acetylenolpyruvoylglucosamine reductase [Candidatus Nomurabacteria bacterium RIFCSPLOWO2_12_FULL_44_11]
MTIKKDYDLTKLNTFGISARAKFFAEITNEADLGELFDSKEFKNNKKLFLGGGSNILLLGDFPGIVIVNRLKEITVLDEDEESMQIRAMSGEVWHDLVNFAVERSLWGIENLSFIPGTVGAAPMQNIGAYGAELKNVLESVETIEVKSGHLRTFSMAECQLGYRDSIFKQELKDKYFILAITLRLSKLERKNLSYKVLREYFEKNKLEPKAAKDISEAVTSIRKSKLPDPTIIGNAGSFFKNVFVEEKKLGEFLTLYPDMPYFREGGVHKIPAAWLIEQCGPENGTSWKGYRVGNTGVHKRQALVLVNYGGASGQAVKELAEEIIDSVFKKFGLKLTPEVNLI